MPKFTDFYSRVMVGKSFSMYKRVPATIPLSYPTAKPPIDPENAIINRFAYE